MKEIYTTYFSPTKIKEILSKTHDGFLSFVSNTIEQASLDTAKTVGNYLQELFQDEKLKLRELVSRRNNLGETMFSMLEKINVDEEKLHVFIDLLRETFKTDEIKIFDKYF